MSGFREQAVNVLAGVGTRYLPFADAASDELPLKRLLRLSLFQVSVGMALVLLIGTLNRVMIVELNVPASIVGIMIALPIVFAPFRALIGYKSDTHESQLGWRRVPYIWRGTMLQFGGLAVMPFALLVLGGQGQAANAPHWIGLVGAAISFLLVGAGMHMVQTVGLALATDLAPPEDQPNVVGLMYVMLLVGMIISALAFGFALDEFSPGRLIQVIQASALITLILNVTALWKMEARTRGGRRNDANTPQFAQAWTRLARSPQAINRLVVIGVGTLGFGMADILLEPYGGQVLNLGVGATTKLTATFAFGGLIGFTAASRILSRGYDPMRMAAYGIMIGIIAFMCVAAAAPLSAPALFIFGTAAIGLGVGIFGHGTLTATMQLAPRELIGLSLGTWGAVQATAAGIAIALSSVIRDIVVYSSAGEPMSAATPYFAVYALEVLLLIVTLVLIQPLLAKPNAELERILPQ